MVFICALLVLTAFIIELQLYNEIKHKNKYNITLKQNRETYNNKKHSGIDGYSRRHRKTQLYNL